VNKNIKDNKAENKVSIFYNTVGWEMESGVTEDARQWEDMRPACQDYIRKCRLRVGKHIPKTGRYILDMASGPIQYDEYMGYSKGFDKRYCVDLSEKALEDAKRKIGDHGVFLHGSFFDIPLEESMFDCSISLHTIYHMDKLKQEEAVRKLLFVTRPGLPVIIVYSNPDNIITWLLRLLRMSLGRLESVDAKDLYFHQHKNSWWARFEDVAQVELLPWRSFSSRVQHKIIPDNRIGRIMLLILFSLEDKFPNFFVKYFSYSMIILKKR